MDVNPDSLAGRAKVQSTKILYGLLEELYRCLPLIIIVCSATVEDSLERSMELVGEMTRRMNIQIYTYLLFVVLR